MRELEEDVFLGRRFLVSGLDGNFDGDDLLRAATDHSQFDTNDQRVQISSPRTPRPDRSLTGCP